MSKKPDSFTAFTRSLSEKDRQTVRSFTDGWKKHFDLPASEEKLLLEDAREALMALTGAGTDLDEAVRRLSPANLGGFYAHEALSWYPLDDAAKIYPLSLKFGRMPIFRLSCYLLKPVVPQLLQAALDFTIKRFPSFATIVRRGFIWHYLDSIKRRFSVSKESGPPCQPLKITAAGVQSFRVLYHENRISVEFFHVLTDGHGGTVFLKTLVAEYLRLTGVEFTPSEGVFDINEPARGGEFSNDFERFCPNSRKTGGFGGKAALQMGGKLSRLAPCRVCQLVYSTDSLLECAHNMGVSVTALVLSLMFHAQCSATESREGLMKIQVPVDMRHHFTESETLRNFSMYCSIDLSPNQVTDIRQTALEVADQLKSRSTFEEMAVMMTTARKLVRSLRFIPLVAKIPVARFLYGFLGDSRFSNTLSNLGRITMPPELASQIAGFDFVLGTTVVSRAACAICSFGGNTVLSVSKSTKDPSFEERLLTLSESLGLETRVTETPLYE